MSVFGDMSKGERNRVKIRVMAAMARRPKMRAVSSAGVRRTGT